MELRLEIDDALVNDAALVYETLGIDTETAVRMFLKRTVLEQRLPLSTSVPSADSVERMTEKTGITKRTKNVITKVMVEDIWRRFSGYLEEGGSINSIAQDAHEATGMNQGSAFIYLTILDNLINGKHNTRNMKMSDLEYLMDQIKGQLDDRSYVNSISSLRKSLPYWDKEAFGQFAAKVQRYLDSIEDGGR